MRKTWAHHVGFLLPFTVDRLEVQSSDSARGASGLAFQNPVVSPGC